MNIAVLLFHEVQAFDAVGPYTFLNLAKERLLEPDMNLYTFAKSRSSVQTAEGLTITPLYGFASTPRPDVLIIPGGKGVAKVQKDKAVVSYVKTIAPSLRILASVSSGAMFLGHLGLLKDQIVTSHHELLSALEDFEVLRVSRDKLVRNEAGVWCAAEGVSGLQLAYALVHQLYSRDLADQVARHMGMSTEQIGLF